MTGPGVPEAPRPVIRWVAAGDGAYVLELSSGEWIQVMRVRASSAESWRVEGRLGGTHYRLADAFATKEVAQGCALLLAMRLAPGQRDALHAVIDGIPGVWWWMLSPRADAAADDHRTITSSRASGSAAAAERSGRAAGAGWWLYVYGPAGAAHAFGRLPGRGT